MVQVLISVDIVLSIHSRVVFEVLAAVELAYVLAEKDSRDLLGIHGRIQVSKLKRNVLLN